MKAKKLPSGSWRIQVYAGTEDSKRKYVSFTADTKAEVEWKAAEYKRTRPKKHDMTVEEAVKEYIKMSQVLSPTTVHGYKKMLANGFRPLMKVTVKDLNERVIQEAINQECRRPSWKSGKPISAKTVINEWTLLASALKAVCGVSYTVKLPQKQQHVKDLPDPQAVMDAIVGSSIELPCLLAMWLSFSMSEIRGLKASSIKNGYVVIDQVMVDAEDGSMLKHNAKTATRLRMHCLPPYLLDLIEHTDAYCKYTQTGTDGLLVPLTHDQIYKRWTRICKKHGFIMTFHDLRHMSASIMLALGVPDKYAMERGGWSTPHVMKSVYQHTLSAERQHVDRAVNTYFETLLCNTNMQHDSTKGLKNQA